MNLNAKEFWKKRLVWTVVHGMVFLTFSSGFIRSLSQDNTRIRDFIGAPHAMWLAPTSVVATTFNVTSTFLLWMLFAGNMLLYSYLDLCLIIREQLSDKKYKSKPRKVDALIRVAPGKLELRTLEDDVLCPEDASLIDKFLATNKKAIEFILTTQIKSRDI